MLSLLLPNLCTVCTRPLNTGRLCRLCTPQVAPGPRCASCYSVASDLNLEQRCALCRTLASPFHQLRYLWEYTGQAADLITTLKYRPSLALTRLAGSMLAEYLGVLYPHPAWDGVVPVPSSRDSLAWRGFNPCYILAQELRRTLRCRLVHGLTHTGNNPPQATLRTTERLKNVRHAFSAHHIPSGAHLLLVDDVATTGATAAACATALLAAGAGRVDLVTLARTPTWQEHRQAVASTL